MDHKLGNHLEIRANEIESEESVTLVWGENHRDTLYSQPRDLLAQALFHEGHWQVAGNIKLINISFIDVQFEISLLNDTTG